jgi:hypothetical protein
MSEVTIKFEVDTCRDDCPFCELFKGSDEMASTWFCSRLMASPEGSPYTIIKDMFTKPLKDCPFREENI